MYKCVYRASGFVGISTTIKSKGYGSVYHFTGLTAPDIYRTMYGRSFPWLNNS